MTDSFAFIFLSGAKSKQISKKSCKVSSFLTKMHCTFLDFLCPVNVLRKIKRADFDCGKFFIKRILIIYIYCYN